MPKNVGEIRVGANGSVFVAPDGTALPEDIEDELDPAFVDLGFLSEDGATLKDGKTITDISVWQRFYPARKLVSAREFTAAMVLRQWSGIQAEFAFGGATVETTTNGFRLSPPPAETLDIRSMVIEYLDGDVMARWVIPRGIVSDDVETKIVRTAASDLPIGFSALASEDEDPWYKLTNDPTFAEST